MKQQMQLALLYYFRFWARIAIRIYQPLVVGVTGSAGKTSCKQAIGAALAAIPEMQTAVLNGNSETGIPLSILGIEPKNYSAFDWLRMVAVAPFGIFFCRNIDTLVIEYGIDSPTWPKNMDYLLSVVQPDIAVVLTVSGAHMMEFEKVVENDAASSEEYRNKVISRIAEEKMKLANSSEAICVVNADNTYMQPYISQECFTFGDDGDMQYGEYVATLEGTRIAYVYEGQNIELFFEGQLLPKVYQQTFAGALLACMQLGIDIGKAAAAMQKMVFPKGRSTLLHGIRDSVIVDSSYNASKEPTLSLIDLVQEVAKDRPTVFLFGDMRELGNIGDLEHEEVAKYAAERFDYVYCLGEQTQKVLHLFSERDRAAEWFTDARTLGTYLKKHLPKNAIVLVKGSQNTIFLEETVEAILANHNDTERLCRQSPDWKKRKEKYFRTLFRT